MLIGDDQVEVLAVAQCAIRRQAVDCDEVVRLVAKAVLVQLLDLDILHGRRLELLQRCAARLLATRDGQILPPGLVGRDLHALARPRLDVRPAGRSASPAMRIRGCPRWRRTASARARPADRGRRDSLCTRRDSHRPSAGHGSYRPCRRRECGRPRRSFGRSGSSPRPGYSTTS